MEKSTKINKYTVDGDVHKVLINDEGQYSIWPQAQNVPMGWKEVGYVGSKQECSAYVDENWTDMRPISLQMSMNKQVH